MTVTKEEMRAIRLNLVHQMYDYIMKTGYEEIFKNCIWDCIPDAPTEEDFEFFADDADEFKYMCEIFGDLIHAVENY